MYYLMLQTDTTKLQEEPKTVDQEAEKKRNENDNRSAEIADLKQELADARKAHQERCLQIEAAAKKAQLDLEQKLKDVENYLHESKTKVQELEAKSRSKNQWWNKKEHIYKTFTEFQLGALKVGYGDISNARK